MEAAIDARTQLPPRLTATDATPFGVVAPCNDSWEDECRSRLTREGRAVAGGRGTGTPDRCVSVARALSVRLVIVLLASASTSAEAAASALMFAVVAFPQCQHAMSTHS